MIIGNISVKENGGNLRMEAPITLQGETRTCFYEFPLEYANLADTGKSDSFLLSLLLSAMQAGEDIQVEGRVSERLFYQLRDDLVPIMNVFNPMYGKIDIKAEELDAKIYPPEPRRGVGTGFSGGIDSFACVWKNFIDNPPEQYKLTHLFFFNVGAHGMAHSEAELAKVEGKFFAHLQRMRACAAELGLPLVPVNSNVHSFFQIGHLETCSLVTPGAALLMQRGLQRYFFASAGIAYKDLRYQLLFIRDPHNTTELDPLILPYMSTENLLMAASETRLARIEKTSLIVDFAPAQKYLNVCYDYGAKEANCSRCEKCARTLATLELLGKIDSFAELFDFNIYRKQARKAFFARVLARHTKNPVYRSIIEYAKEKDIDLLSYTSRAAILAARLKDSKLHNFLRRIPLLRPAVRALKKVFKSKA